MDSRANQEFLDSMRKNITDMEQAAACLESLSGEISTSTCKLFTQILGSKSFIIVDQNSLWITSSSSQGISAGTFLKASINVNPMSMLKSQAKLMKAGIDLAKGSNPFHSKKFQLAQITSIVPVVEKSSWTQEVNAFNLAVLGRNSEVLEEISCNSKDFAEIESLCTQIALALGHKPTSYGAYVGHLDAEGQFANISRKGFGQNDLIGKGSASSIDAWEKFLVATLKNKTISAHELTSDVKAELFEDGQLMVSYVANRAASASHGSIGLNLLSAAFSAPTHDKKKTDTRSLSIQIVAANWGLEINLNPTQSKKARAIVTRINQNVEVLKDKAPTTVSTAISQDISGSLAKLAELRAQGLLTDDEFNQAKSKLLS
jgi:hypothetical protein